MNEKQKWLSLENVKIEDDFFSPILERTACVTVPDILYKFEHDRGGAIDNFDRVRDGVIGEHAGPEWYDGLTYETITGISDLLVNHYDAVTDLHMDNYVARIASAALQDENGYVNTYTQTMEPSHRFGENGGFLRGQHEIYNAGCLVEAGVHHYMSTGKWGLLDTAVKFARYLVQICGPEPKKNLVPAHSLPEGAMVELYRLFQEREEVRERYPEANDGRMFLKLAEFWIENRGKHCGLPDWENWEYSRSERFVKECGYGKGRPCWGEYAQDKVSIFEQDGIAGHAVRAVLLFSGVAVCAYENDRADYIKVATRMWESMTLRRMHVTGGVGAIRQDEKFGKDYELPQDAYLETCAAIGAAFYSHSMYLLTGEAKYMDCLENILYNGSLVGISCEGNRYSYVNPLVSDGTVHRWSWHECPCCPPMDLKLYGKLPQFIYSYTECCISVNLFISGETVIPICGENVVIRQTGGYPWKGNQKIIFETSVPEEILLRIRIPEWCMQWGVFYNGNLQADEKKNGYALVRKKFAKGDVIEVRMALETMVGFAHPNVRECEKQIVLRHGPFLYCVEETDNRSGLDFIIGQESRIRADYDSNFLGGAIILRGTDQKGREMCAIPFFLWDNREPGRMRMWLDTEFECPQVEWEDRLYSYIALNELLKQ